MSMLGTAGEPATTRPEETPQFAVTLRGYDRLQVDDYADTLRGYLDEAQLRALDAEEELAALQARDAARQTAHEQTTDILPRPDEAAGGVPRPTTDDVAVALTATLRAAEDAAAAIRAEAEADRADARALLATAESEARQRAGEIVDEAQRTVDRLARHAELERNRRDTVRRQIAALRTALDEIGFPGTGEIDLTDQAAQTVPVSEKPTAPAGTPTDEAARTTLLRIPQ